MEPVFYGGTAGRGRVDAAGSITSSVPAAGGRLSPCPFPLKNVMTEAIWYVFGFASPFVLYGLFEIARSTYWGMWNHRHGMTWDGIPMDPSRERKP